MRPALGVAVLSLISYVAILSVAAVLAMTTRYQTSDLLPLVGFGAIFLGAIFFSNSRNKQENVDERAYVTGGGTQGDVRVLPRLNPEAEGEQRSVSGPSGIGSTRIVVGRNRSWLTISFLGFAMIIAGIAAALTVVLATLG